MFGLSKFRSRRRTPKERQRKPKSRRPIPNRSAFKLYDNPLKPRTQRYPTHALIAKAEQYRAQRLANPSTAAEILDRLDIPYERERIFYRTGSCIIADFFIRSRNMVIEVDGSQHSRLDMVLGAIAGSSRPAASRRCVSRRDSPQIARHLCGVW